MDNFEAIEQQIKESADIYLIDYDKEDIDYDLLDMKVQEYETILWRVKDLGGYWEPFEYTLEELKEQLYELESEVLCQETEADERCKEMREERAAKEKGE